MEFAEETITPLTGDTKFMSVITYDMESQKHNNKVMSFHLTVLQAQLVERLRTDPDELNAAQTRMIRKSNFSVTEVGFAPISPAGQSFPVVNGMVGTRQLSEAVQNPPPVETIVKVAEPIKIADVEPKKEIKTTATGNELNIKNKILQVAQDAT